MTSFLPFAAYAFTFIFVHVPYVVYYGKNFTDLGQFYMKYPNMCLFFILPTTSNVS